MRTESSNQSAKIRNYAIAGFCIILTLLALALFFGIFALMGFGATPVNIYSECTNNSANVFIGANSNLKNVKCVALDKEFFDNSEIMLGDLAKGDEDVCRFKITKNTDEPLRFEVRYNGLVKREVCSWQNYQSIID